MTEKRKRSGIFAELKRRNVFRVAIAYLLVAWVLLQVADVLFPVMNLPEWSMRLLAGFMLLGFPLAVFLAWAFEMTPDGVVRSEAVPEDESVTPQTGRKLDYAIVVALLLLGGLILWQQLSAPELPAVSHVEILPAEPAIDVASIAVLPFTDMSPAGDQTYFSDGIAEEILNLLVGVDELKVASRTSAFQFKGRGLGIPEIASELKVRHVVEGSVRKAGDTIRVTAQLIDAENDRHLWSETYDRPLTAENIFLIQDEIASAVVAALGDVLGLTGEPRLHAGRSTDNLDAYELFLKARTLFQQRLDLDRVDALLQDALEQDPNFSRAWEMRSATQFLMEEYQYSDLSPSELHRRTIDFADRALALEPNSAMAIAGKAHVRLAENKSLTASNDLVSVIADLNRAVTIEPHNASALNWRGLAYLMVADLERASDDFQTCIDYEPLYSPCVTNHVAILSALGRDDEALAAYVHGLDNGTLRIYYAPWSLFARLHKELAFKSASNDRNALFGWTGHDKLYRAYQALGEDHSKLIKSMRQFLTQSPGRSRAFLPAIAIPLGAYELHHPAFDVWGISYLKYRQSADFKAYVRETGVLDYWRNQGFPSQCRPTGADDFACK